MLFKRWMFNRSEEECKIQHASFLVIHNSNEPRGSLFEENLRQSLKKNYFDRIAHVNNFRIRHRKS